MGKNIEKDLIELTEFSCSESLSSGCESLEADLKKALNL